MCNEIYKIENNILLYINKLIFFFKRKSIICFVVSNNKFLFFNNKLLSSVLYHMIHIYIVLCFSVNIEKENAKKKKKESYFSKLVITLFSTFILFLDGNFSDN